MRVIFLKNVPNVASAGETKEVADGYGRNFLIPKKLALLADSHDAAQISVQLKAILKKTTDELAGLAQQIEGKEVTIKAKVGAKDRLYGSVTNADIAAELESVTRLAIDKKKIELVEPIRQLGSYEVVIRLGKDTTPKIKVTVTAEEKKEEVEEEVEVEEKKEKKKKVKAEAEDKKKEKPEKAEKKPKAKKKKKVKKKMEEEEEEKEKEKKEEK